MTPLGKTFRRLAFSSGVLSLKIDQTENTDDMMETAKIAAKEVGIVAAGDVVVITAGVPMRVPGRTNLIKADTME